MRLLSRLFGWLAGLVFLAFAGAAALQPAWPFAALLFLAALVMLPPARRLAYRISGWRLSWQLRLSALIVLLTLGIVQTMVNPRSSIYDSPEVRDRLHALYAEGMEGWPVPWENRFVQLPEGRVHVIVSGPPDAPPLLLLHASGTGGWSWRYNAEGLARQFRLYAVDTIGDAGLSEYADLSRRHRSGADQARHVAAVMDRLGIARAAVVGASEGGFIASNLAIHAPERVERLVLLGPMGYSGALGAVLRIAAAQLFPFPGVQDATFRWAFSESPEIARDFDAWFRLVMSGTLPAKVAPLPFSAADRARLRTPALFVLGTRDRVVGPPGDMQARLAGMAAAEVAVIEAGHLMGAEAPEEVNALILGFLAREEP